MGELTVAPLVDSPKRPGLRARSLLLTCSSALLFVFFLVSIAIFSELAQVKVERAGLPFLATLFGLPCLHFALHSRAWAKSDGSLALVLAVCSVCNSLLMLIYILGHASDTLSVVSFALSVIIVIFVLITTKTVFELKAPTRSWTREYPYQSRQRSLFVRRLEEFSVRHPFAVLTSSVVLFLHVTFFLGFAIAFHDRAHSGLALAVETLAESDASRHRELILVKGRNRSKIARILFSEHQSEVVLADSHWLKATTAEVSEASKRDPSLRVKIQNSREIEALVEGIDEDQSQARTVINCMGHSNEKAVRQADSTYSSNFDISDRRGKEACRAVDNALFEIERRNDRTFNVQFEVNGVGDASTSLSNEWKAEYFNQLAPEIDPKLVTEIGYEQLLGDRTQIERHTDVASALSSTTLLDYMYFTVYTITTTGYGDMRPVTPGLKFITIVANLYELFFVVIFFNNILSLLSSRPTIRFMNLPQAPATEASK